MKRRKFIALAGSTAAVWPSTVRAQQAKVPVIGYLGSDSPERFAIRLKAFRRGLSATGFDEGRNVAIEYRWAEGNIDRLPALAADLVRRAVSVIVTPSSIHSLLAAKAATTTIPIVFEAGIDPVAFGLVVSLNRPGGNITGATSLNTELGPKRLELLQELSPRANTVALLIDPANPTAEYQTAQLRAAASTRRLDLHVMHAGTEREFDAAFAKLVPLRVGGLVIATDIFYGTRSKLLAVLALRHVIPAIHFTREFAEAGGLMSYGGIFADTHRQAGIYAGRILKGEKPADLPVQQVTKFDLLINLMTAKALGQTIPDSLLARADEMIE
jgi:putative tryptophan/tyrosine transport system substrate-binding protein